MDRARVTEVDAIIEAKGLKQMSDTGALEKIVDDVLATNQKNIDEYRAGKDKAFNALVGQVMKASQGKANPAQVNALLKVDWAAAERLSATARPRVAPHSGLSRARSSSKRALTRRFSSSCSPMKRFCTAALCALSSILRRIESGALLGSLLVELEFFVDLLALCRQFGQPRSSRPGSPTSICASASARSRSCASAFG